MVHDKSFFKRMSPVGPGGRSCGCCFPQKGRGARLAKTQDRKLERRKSKQNLLYELLTLS